MSGPFPFLCLPGPGHLSPLWPGLLFFTVILGAAERRPAILRLSDGREFRGEIGFKPEEIRFFEEEKPGQGRFLNLFPHELDSLSFRPRKREMVRPWRFKDAGSDEKEFLPGACPLIQMEAQARLKSGKALTGHLQTKTVTLRRPAGENPMDFEEEKFILKYEWKGEVGQRFEDLIYVAEIRFTDGPHEKAGANTHGLIRGRVQGGGRLEEVAAYGLGRGHAYAGQVDVQAGTYRIPDLPADRYDLAFRASEGTWAGFTEGPLAGTGEQGRPARPIEAGDREAIGGFLAAFEDFFDEQRVMALGGDRDHARTLIAQRRLGTVHDQAALGGRRIARLEIWRWQLRDTQWHVQTHGRATLFRYFEEKKEAPRPIRFLPAWKPLLVDPARTVETVYDLTLSPPPAGETRTGPEGPDPAGMRGGAAVPPGP